MLGWINKCINRDKATCSKDEEKKASTLQEWYVAWEYEESTSSRSPNEHGLTFSPCPSTSTREDRDHPGPQEFTFFQITNCVKATGRGRLMGVVGSVIVPSTRGGRFTAPESQTHTIIKKMYFIRVLEPIAVANLDLGVTGRLKHKNLARVVGWCHDHDHDSNTFSVVNELVCNGTLHSHLHSDRSLPWEARYKIACDLARAILYLHDEFEVCTLHMDINSRDVLLDSDFNAKLTNLGAFKVEMLEAHVGALVVGTSAGNPSTFRPFKERPSKEANVHSFGNVALEIACGQDPDVLSREKSSIWHHVMEFYARGVLLKSVDRRLGRNFDQRKMERLMLVGLLCAQPDPKSRPCIKHVTRYLNFEDPLPPQLPTSAISAFLGTCSSSLGGRHVSGHADHSGAMTQAGSSRQPPPIAHDRDQLVDAACQAQDVVPLEIGTATGNMISPMEPPKNFEIEVVKGVIEGLHESLQKEMRFDKSSELVRKYTQALVVMCVPTNNWNLLVEDILRAARLIDQFKVEKGDPNYDPTKRNLSALREDIERCDCYIERCEQEHGLLLGKRGDLERQLVDLEKQMEDVEGVLELVARRKAQEMQMQDLKKKEREMLELAQSISFRLSSFCTQE